MTALRRVAACALLAIAVLAATAGVAGAHASLVTSSPAARGRVKVGPSQAVLVFSEPVEVLNRRDVTVVDGDGVRIDNGAHTDVRNSRRIVVGLRGPMVPDSYTVRFRVVSADSHTEAGAFVFAVGRSPLAAPILAGAGGLLRRGPGGGRDACRRARRAHRAPRARGVPRPGLGAGRRRRGAGLR